jgi:hypothetical protein
VWISPFSQASSSYASYSYKFQDTLPLMGANVAVYLKGQSEVNSFR